MSEPPRSRSLLARTWHFPTEAHPTREAFDAMLDVLLPEIEVLPGYAGVTVLVERETGSVSATVFWETLEDLQRATDRESNAARGTLVITGSPATGAAVHDVLINRPAPVVSDRELGADR
ncbi:hypothetical protein H5V45_10560 [Nocardioides sp. KIGAM211]|uniref:ABM domain-containing protein n=1 Tax=Nocardioides luti TaxID=2761101 RepID=A0A7X0VBA3_9ACTN|nr:hypothetical protein [Nocardioides luti]